ncbi:30S ribosomal protein S16 [candidate division NPL-UPA2 bacterium]|nr:30S ribosomal protein S16 [candidate division NPL-UPA2 bacterium]
MAVVIRLKRMGTKKRPFYRLVVADSRMPRDGRFIETIGQYNPLEEPARVSIIQEKALYWLKQGAKLSQTAKQILKKGGVWEKFKPQGTQRGKD